MNEMMIRKLEKTEIKQAFPLVYEVFCEYEADNYPEDGKHAFRDAIYSEDFLDMLSAFGAFEEDRLVGIIATRNEGRHVALFFVDGDYHRKGIGRKLWDAVLEDSTAEEITVNSSEYAVNIYRKLGFEQAENLREENGIRFVPMVYRACRQEDSDFCKWEMNC